VRTISRYEWIPEAIVTSPGEKWEGVYRAIMHLRLKINAAAPEAQSLLAPRFSVGTTCTH
jgi:hypothetical protein